MAALPTRPPDPAGRRPGHVRDVVPLTVEEMYELGCDLDEADPEHAESSYREVMEQSPQHADAHINLGRILHERGDLTAAEKHYRAALETRPIDATAHFNLGVALEDAGRHARGAGGLSARDHRGRTQRRRALQRGPALRPAGRLRAALRHLRICRELARKQR